MGDERPDGWTSTRNFHICYARVRTMIGSLPGGWSQICNFLNCWTSVRTKADCRPDDDIWIAILALCKSLSGRESTSSGRLKQSSLKLNLERIWSWSIIERRPDGLLRRLDGCKLEQLLLEIVKVRTEIYFVRTNDAWSIGRLDSMVRRPDGWNSGQMGVQTGWHDRPDGWQGTEDFLTCRQNLLKLFWIAKSLVKQHLLHTSDFVQTEWGQ